MDPEAPSCYNNRGDAWAELKQYDKALADYEELSGEVVATETLLREALFGAKPSAEAALAYIGADAVGFAVWFYNFSTFVGRPGLYLEDIFVLPDWRGPFLQDYRERAAASAALWPQFAARSGLPYMPAVATGWDASPRGADFGEQRPDKYPWSPVVTGEHPEHFGRRLARATRAHETGWRIDYDLFAVTVAVEDRDEAVLAAARIGRSACGDEAARDLAEPRDLHGVEHVRSEVCRRCHEEHWASWRRTSTRLSTWWWAERSWPSPWRCSPWAVGRGRTGAGCRRRWSRPPPASTTSRRRPA